MPEQMWGADADALDRLAREMHAAAMRLDTISKQITARLMSSAWEGTDADRFRADWSRRYRGQLRRSADFLRGSQGQLVGSAQSQRSASAAEGGSGPGGPLDFILRPLGVAWETVRDASEDWRDLAAPLIGLGVLTRGAATMGRYTDAYRPLAHANDFFKYKRSPILQALAPLGGAAKSTGGLVKQINDNPAFRAANSAAGGIGRAASVIDVIARGTDAVRFDSTEDGGDRVRDVADTAASALKASRNPVAYLAGVNVSIWSDVVETGVSAFQSGDMSLKGLPSPFSRQSFTEVYLPTAKEVGGQLLSLGRRWF